MLKRIIESTLQGRFFILFILVLLIGIGIYSVRGLSIDAFPDVTNVQVEIVSQAPGMSPQEIERFVTYPLEIAMRGIPGLEKMRSVTKFGISVLTLVFDDGVDIYFARQLVFQRLSEAEREIPETAKCEMGPVATAMGEIYQYVLAGEKVKNPDDPVYLAELRTIQDWLVAPLLKSVPGVSEINSFGGYVKQFQVVCQPDLLAKYDLTVQDVYAALAENNRNAGGNIIERYSEQFIVRGEGMIRNQSDIASIMIRNDRGVPVFIRDIASIQVGQFMRQGAALTNQGREVVGGVVMMLKGSNPLKVVALIEKKVSEINQGNMLPLKLKLRPYYVRSQIIHASIGTVMEALLIGVILVLFILFLFLRNLRGALAVVLALPLSLLLTFTMMKTFGIAANLMSLGGLAISLGMIIDATIIQVENVQRRLSEASAGESHIRIVLDAVLEVRKPSILGELIIALTFAPILALQGMEGKMFIPLALTVGIALLASMLLSIFAIPVLCSFFLKIGPEKRNPVLDALKRAYGRTLSFSLRHRWLVIICVLISFAAALIVFQNLGREFLPIMDEGAFDMDMSMLPGTSLPESMAVNRQILEKLSRFPELDVAVGKVGQSGIALEGRGVNQAGYVGSLKPKETWRAGFDRDQLTDAMRREIESIPGIAFGFSQPIQCRIDELVAGTRAQLIIRLFGDDLTVLRSKINEMAAILARMAGTTDLMVERVAGQPYISIRADRGRIAFYGLSIGKVMETLEIAVGGKVATQVYADRGIFDCLVRMNDNSRGSVQALAGIRVPDGRGSTIPLGQLADIREEEGPAQISREDGSRFIGVEMNISGRDIAGYVNQARREIARQVALPTGYYLIWGGQFENQERAMNRLLIIVPSVVLLIFFLLFMTFQSFGLSLLVIINLPFALIGGIFALKIAGMYLSVPASVGFIVLFGVAVLNGIVLVSCFRQLQGKEGDVRDTIRCGCDLRLRPVLMTAAISVFSLVPMLFATGPGSEIQKPLAVVVIGGLFSSTLLTLVVLPVLYSLFGKRANGGEKASCQTGR